MKVESLLLNKDQKSQDIIEEIIILSDYGRQLAENVDNPTLMEW